MALCDSYRKVIVDLVEYVYLQFKLDMNTDTVCENLKDILYQQTQEKTYKIDTANSCLWDTRISLSNLIELVKPTQRFFPIQSLIARKCTLSQFLDAGGETAIQNYYEILIETALLFGRKGICEYIIKKIEDEIFCQSQSTTDWHARKYINFAIGSGSISTLNYILERIEPWIDPDSNFYESIIESVSERVTHIKHRITVKWFLDAFDKFGGSGGSKDKDHKRRRVEN
jgi:hypothetical protein